MPRAFTQEWVEELAKRCHTDEEFNEEADGFDRTVTLHILADPDRGVLEDRWVGFNPPQMTDLWAGADNEKATTSDYIIEGTYADWHAVNERTKGLVASLLDQSILLRAGKTSYIAMFVPGVDRFYELSKTITDSYDGDYERKN
jgi:hypothetical protein